MQASSKPIVPTPRAILFDLDDTLCDYASARTLRLRRAFSLDLADETPADVAAQIERMIAESVEMHPHGVEHFPALFARFGRSADAAAAAARWYQTHRFHGLALFADAVTTLTAVRPRRVALITNGPTEVQRDKIALLEVAPLVDAIVVSEEFGAWKPDPAIFHEALRLIGSTPAEAIFVGDSAEHDIAGAQAAGIRSVWVNRGDQPWRHPAPPPDYEISSLTALLSLLGLGGSRQ